MRKEYDDDDGRTIVSMEGVGVPWHRRIQEQFGTKNENDAPAAGSGSGSSFYQQPDELNKEEKRALTKGALGASLMIALIYGAVFGLFILFCVFVWFR